LNLLNFGGNIFGLAKAVSRKVGNLAKGPKEWVGRRAWVDHNVRTLESLMADVGRTVHEVDPAIGTLPGRRLMARRRVRPGEPRAGGCRSRCETSGLGRRRCA